MPAQVVVVTRSRRSLFAAPRALPDWLRSVWVAFFRASPIDAVAEELDATSLRSVAIPLFPRLVRESNGAHRCIGCDLCVRVCPSRCLSLGTDGEGEALRVTRFELEQGACIGCRLCAEACPEEAIEMVGAAKVELAPLFGGRLSTNLLATQG